MQFVVPVITEAIPAADLQIQATRRGDERPRVITPSGDTLEAVRCGIEGYQAGRVRVLPDQLGERFSVVPVRRSGEQRSEQAYLLEAQDEAQLTDTGSSGSVTMRQERKRRTKLRARAAVMGKLAALRREAVERIVPATVISYRTTRGTHRSLPSRSIGPPQRDAVASSTEAQPPGRVPL
jgi:hypothetical protein